MSVYRMSMPDDTEERAIIAGCDCGTPEHYVHLAYWNDEEWPELFFQFRLKGGGFFYRVWRAIQYVFGYHSRYGEWDEIVLTPKDARVVAEFLLGYVDTALKKESNDGTSHSAT